MKVRQRLILKDKCIICNHNRSIVLLKICLTDCLTHQIRARIRQRLIHKDKCIICDSKRSIVLLSIRKILSIVKKRGVSKNFLQFMKRLFLIISVIKFWEELYLIIFMLFLDQKTCYLSTKKGMSRDVPTSKIQLFVIISTKIQGGALWIRALASS